MGFIKVLIRQSRCDGDRFISTEDSISFLKDGQHWTRSGARIALRETLNARTALAAMLRISFSRRSGNQTT